MKKVKLFLNGFREIEFSPILIGAIILGFAGWQNMYPLVYPDTGTYVITGLEGRVPYDRPLLYGLFLKHTSMRATMWMAMYAQAILVSSVIFTFIKSYFLKQNYRIIYFLCLFILVGCTAISIKTSTLIPDVFTPLPILCFFILLHGSLNITLKIWFSFIMVFAIAVHQSHLMILVSALLFSGIAVGMRLGKKIFIQQLLRVKFLIPIVIISFLLTPTINLLYSGRFFWSKSNGIFMMGKFAENGMLQKYLLENCGSKSLELCKYKDEIPGDFLWDSRSPLSKMGGWENPSPEFDQITRDIITTPKYFAPLILKSISASAVQFFSFQITVRAENAPMGMDSPPHSTLKHVYKHEIENYINSNQNIGRLDYTAIDNRQSLLMVILITAYFLLHLSKLRNYVTGLNRVMLFVLFYTISNAMVCGALSIPNPRYQTRVFWLIPFMIILIITKILIENRREVKDLIFRNN